MGDHGDCDLAPALCAATASGDADTVLALLAVGASVGGVSPDGDTPLISAAAHDHSELLELLLANGADVNQQRPRDDATALHAAVAAGGPQSARLLLEHHAKVNIPDDKGDAPLAIAACIGSMELAELLIAFGAAVDAANRDGATALCAAANGGHSEVVDLLAANGADVNLKRLNGWSPLSIASFRGYVDVVTVLLDRGADANTADVTGATPLYVAVHQGHGEIVGILLDHEAEANIQTLDGLSPMFVAASACREDIMQLLLVAGASVDVPNLKAWTPLHAASVAGHVEAVSLLLRNGAAIDHADCDGDTAVMKACCRGHLDVVLFLLEWGAAVDETDLAGRSALFVAAESGHLEVVIALIDAGADASVADDLGATPLHAASSSGHAEAATALVDRGASVNAVDANGKTALLGAAAQENTEVVLALLERDANLDITDSNGDSALTIASRMGRLGTVVALLDCGAGIDLPNAVSGRAALFTAARAGHLDVVDELVRRGAAIDTPDDCEETALSAASRHGHAAIVSLLLDNEVLIESTNALGRTSLHHAAANGHLEVTRVLLEGGAGVDVSDMDGDTALHLAARHGHSTVVARLLNSSADPELKNAREEGALHAACGACHLGVVAELLTHSAGVDDPDASGNTPLTIASAVGSAEITKILLEHGASLEACNEHGHTALLVAGSCGHFDVVRVLLDAGANMNVRATNGDTLLVYAARWGRIGIAGVLFETGWQPFAATDEGEVALLPASLNRVLRLSAEMQEFEGLWRSVAVRFVGILESFQQEPEATVSQTSVRRLVRILMRFVGLRALYDGANVFARLVAARRAVSSVQDIHAEIDHFLRRFDWDWTDPMHAEWSDQVRAEQAAIVQAFEDAACDDDLLLSELGDEARQLEALYLLEYEKREHSDTYSPEQLALLELYLEKTMQAIGDAEPVPEWFIPSHEVEVGGPASVYEGDRIHRGKWLNSNVLIRKCDLEQDKFAEACSAWFPLSHPNVINVFGAYHLHSPNLIVFENASSTNLMDYLADGDHQRALWRTMYEVALGFGFLHERQIVLGDLRCDDIWVGKDGLAMVPGCMLNDRSRGEDLEWLAPEIMRGEPPSCASDVYAFGICILEAVAGKSPWPDWSEYTIYSEASAGYLPARPDGMTQPQWHLIQSMCRFEPSERVTMTSVIEYLKFFAANESGAETLPGSSAGSSSSLRDYIVPELSSTIEAALSNLSARCSAVSDASDLAHHAHARLANIYNVLQATHKSPRDVEVSKFCDVLVMFYSFMRAAISATSMIERAKSRRVSLRANVLHREIDVVLDLLRLSSIDPIHVWSPSGARRSSALETLTEGPEPEVEFEEQSDSSSGVKLVYFETSRLNPWYDMIDASDAEPEDSRLPWLIPIQELRYQREDSVGVGAFGAVYRGMWLGTPVVVKFMGYEDDSDPDNLALFFHELRVWYPLHHPHVVRLFGACHVGKRFFVCEYAGNGTLLEFLARLPNRERVWKKLYELSLGLQHVHKKNIVHNDLKCDNFLVGSDGLAKLSDFGLSCIPNSAEVTVDAKQQGAMQWRSPEYLRGERLTLASDIYSFGMCILEAVTGASPWGRTFDVYVRMKVKKGFLPPRPPALTGEQWGLVEMMCAREPSHRLQIASVVEQLRESLQETKRQPFLTRFRRSETIQAW